MSDEAALLAAIVAHPEEDTPRLAYADWLDENGDPDRAAFIRVQCRLADMPPSHPDWVDLTEQQDELVARLKSRYRELTPELAEGFYGGHFFLSTQEEPFRRGFRYFITCQSDHHWSGGKLAHAIEELTRLLRTTSIGGVHFDSTPLGTLTALLASPAAAELTGLALRPFSTSNLWRAEFADFLRFLGNSPSIRRVRQLYLHESTRPLPAAELAAARTFDSVRRMTLPELVGSKTALEKLTRAAWFRRLHHIHCSLNTSSSVVSVIGGLGRLPELHTLELPLFPPGGVATLAGGKFPALARLIYNGPLTVKYAGLLAKAKFPSLTVFQGRGGLRNDGLSALLGSKWFGQLRVLDLSDNAIYDKGVKALAAHPVAKGLRALKLAENLFGNGGLTAIAASGAFPALTTLDLHRFFKPKEKPAELAAFLSALQLPQLRHLNLAGWQIGNEGAKALAADPAMAGLTRLNVNHCGIGDAGAQAIFASPHLRNLVELQMSSNSIKSSAEALADPAVMPRLGECNLWGNRIPKESAERLRRAGLSLTT